MGNEKHVLPDTEDTFASRIKRGAAKTKKKTGNNRRVVYGPDNEPLEKIEELQNKNT